MVLELYKISPRVGWIAERVGLSTGQTRRVLDTNYPTLEAFPETLLRDVILASDAGHSPKELAHDFGVSEWKIRQILAEHVAAQELRPLRRRGHRISPESAAYSSQDSSMSPNTFGKRTSSVPHASRDVEGGPMTVAENPYTTLVERFANLCFEGKLPPCSDGVLVGAIMLTVCKREEWQDQPEPVIDAFEQGITQAVRDVRERLALARQVGEVVSPWTN
jgi:hypothetical protein